MSKLPQITAFFWIMKICATTLGETAGDLLLMTMNVGYAVSSMILIGLFLTTLATQLVAKNYNPLLYWLSSFQPAQPVQRCQITWIAL